MRVCAGLVVGVLMATALYAGTLDDIHVVALFKGKAMVVIDGERQMLRIGETSPQGVTLVSADSAMAVFDYRGERLERRLDNRTRAPAANALPAEEVQVYRDRRGMFRTVGSINGLPVSFLVDTGASAIAMNSTQARRLGLDFRVDGDSTYVTTASQVVQAYRLVLDRVKVGSIELHNVVCVVIDGPQPDEVLLGMTFLGRLDIRNEANRLLLRKKY